MEASLLILGLWLGFGGSHILLSSLRLRPRLVERLGSGGFLGLYSLVSLATFVPLVSVYMRNRHAGPMLWNLRAVPGLQLFVICLSGLCFTLAAASLFQPSPALMGGGGAVRARGLTRITRHPLFMPFALLAPAHLLLNGFLTDVLFFGGLGLFSVIGCMHQDARKRVTEHETLGEFFAETSLFPFVAVATGRTRLVAAELPWLGLAVGAAAAVGFYRLHWVMFV